MNKSPYIDPKKCASCGECCKSFQIWYSKEDKALLSEVERFRMLDTPSIIVHEEPKGYYVEFKIRCKQLKTDKKGYYCEIYDKKRPDLCELYPHKNTADCPHKTGKK